MGLELGVPLDLSVGDVKRRQPIHVPTNQLSQPAQLVQLYTKHATQPTSQPPHLLDRHHLARLDVRDDARRRPRAIRITAFSGIDARLLDADRAHPLGGLGVLAPLALLGGAADLLFLRALGRLALLVLLAAAVLVRVGAVGFRLAREPLRLARLLALAPPRLAAAAGALVAAAAAVAVAVARGGCGCGAALAQAAGAHAVHRTAAAALSSSQLGAHDGSASSRQGCV